MKFFGQGRTRLAAVLAAFLVTTGLGYAVAAGSSPAPRPSNAVMKGNGIDQFGLTKAYYEGRAVNFRYSKGFWCDTAVKSAATSGCEAGKKWKNPPSKKDFDPVFVLVPLGFDVPAMSMECPDGLICVDHPGTIDLSRLEPALKPLYPDLTDAELTAALKNYATPGHDHFIGTKANEKQEWWDVRIVGVTDKAEYDKIRAHRSLKFLKQEVKAGKTTGVIPTNFFLKFAVR
jgi:hypothetical protein